MEPLEVLQWVVLGLLAPGLTTIGVMLVKVRGTQVSILAGIMEMHKWHAPQMLKAIDTLIGEIKGLRGDFRDVIPKLQEEHRVQDKAVAELRGQVADIKTILQQGGR